MQAVEGYSVASGSDDTAYRFGDAATREITVRSRNTVTAGVGCKPGSGGQPNHQPRQERSIIRHIPLLLGRMGGSFVRPEPRVGAHLGRGVLCLGISLGGLSWPAPLAAQTSPQGSPATALWAATLGAYSGGLLALSASLVPCGQQLEGIACTRVSVAAGALWGGVAGGVIGARDADRARSHATSAGIGALAGGAAGLVLREVIRQHEWVDAGAGVLLGAAVGAAPVGAGVGFAVGAAVGATVWLLVPTFEAGDAAGLGLVGLALGGLTEWAVSAARSNGDRAPVGLTMSVPLPFGGP